MTYEMGQGRRHQATDGGEQQQALVNITSVPVQESRRHQDREQEQVAERIDQPEERIALDVEIAAQVEAAARHRNCCHVSQNDHCRGEEHGGCPEAAMHGNPSRGHERRLRKEHQEPSGVDDAMGNGKWRGRSFPRVCIDKRRCKPQENGDDGADRHADVEPSFHGGSARHRGRCYWSALVLHARRIPLITLSALVICVRSRRADK